MLVCLLFELPFWAVDGARLFREILRGNEPSHCETTLLFSRLRCHRNDDHAIAVKSSSGHGWLIRLDDRRSRNAMHERAKQADIPMARDESLCYGNNHSAVASAQRSLRVVSDFHLVRSVM